MNRIGLINRSTYIGVFLLVSGGRVSGRGGVGSGFVCGSSAVQIGSGNSDDGEDNNGDLMFELKRLLFNNLVTVKMFKDDNKCLLVIVLVACCCCLPSC